MGLPVHKYQHEAMNTYFELMIATDEEAIAQSAAQKVFECVDRLELTFSRFLDTSEVAFISRLKPGETFQVSPEMMELLMISTRVCAATAGAFDVTVGPLMDALREVRMHWEAVSDETRRRALDACGMNRLVIDQEHFLIAVKPDRRGEASPLELDFGAVAKGYALDQAVGIIERDWDFPDFLIHGGTSTVVARGSMGDGLPGWPVGVGGDWQTRAGFDTVRLQNGAISGSGFEVRGAHVVDVRKGVAAVRHAAAWASAPDAATADALSTAFLGESAGEIRSACETLGGCGALTARQQPVWLDRFRSPVWHWQFAGLDKGGWKRV